MMEMLVNLGVLLALVAVNGLFATAEMAFVVTRAARLRQLAEGGNSRAKVALSLAESPNRFLSTVQVGITLIGIAAGAFGGASISDQLAVPLRKVEWLAPYSGVLSLVVVVSLITFLSLVLGELVPKRLALSNPLGFCLLLSRPMQVLSAVTAPAIALLATSTDFVLDLMGVKAESDPVVTRDEVKQMVEQGHHAGVFHKAEIEMVEGVMELDQQRVGQIMTPRARIIWLNVADPDEVNWRKIVSSDHTYFPVYEGVTDNVLGMVSVKALWANLAVGVPANLRNLVVQPLFVPESMNAVRLLETFRETGKHIAMVSDEFGIPQGLVTVNDLLEAIVGDLPSEADRTRKCFRKREDGSIVVDAMMDIDDFKSELGIKSLPQETSEEYRSVGGFVMSQLGRIPREGDTFESAGYRFEVIDMDRHRVDKVLVVSVKA